MTFFTSANPLLWLAASFCLYVGLGVLVVNAAAYLVSRLGGG